MATLGYFVTSQSQAITVLESSNLLIQHYFQLLSLSLNFCLCLDIVLTMSNPFSPHERRMKFYLIGSLVSAAVLSKLTLAASSI